MIVGYDFGGVLTRSDTPPREGFLKIPPREGSYEIIAKGKSMGDIPVLNSKASNEEKEAKARLWIAHWGFDELFEDYMYYCREQEGKIAIARRVGMTVMLDNNIPQLELLDGVVPHRMLYGATIAPHGMTAVQNWAEAGQVLDQIRDISPE